MSIFSLLAFASGVAAKLRLVQDDEVTALKRRLADMTEQRDRWMHLAEAWEDRYQAERNRTEAREARQAQSTLRNCSPGRAEILALNQQHNSMMNQQTRRNGLLRIVAEQNLANVLGGPIEQIPHGLANELNDGSSGRPNGAA
jgi:murein L,D-transpeptidase YcbB/YkuD